MTYSRPTLQEEEFLPTGFTEVRKDFLFLFSLSLLWHSLLQLVWGTDRWWEAEDCVFLGASGVEQRWRMGWGLPLLNGPLHYVKRRITRTETPLRCPGAEEDA